MKKKHIKILKGFFITLPATSLIAALYFLNHNMEEQAKIAFIIFWVSEVILILGLMILYIGPGILAGVELPEEANELNG
ncbi:MAG: hypothetical protein WC523_02205 [Patescibacteria group bacterium]|jgi:hypothetical protein